MSQVSVGTSPTKIAAVDGDTRTFFIQNLGSENVFWDRDDEVSASTGAKLKPDDAISLEALSSVYAVAASGTQTVAVVDL